MKGERRMQPVQELKNSPGQLMREGDRRPAERMFLEIGRPTVSCSHTDLGEVREETGHQFLDYFEKDQDREITPNFLEVLTNRC